MIWRMLATVFALGLVAGCATPGPSTASSSGQPAEQSEPPPPPGFLVQYTVDEDAKNAWLSADGSGFEVLMEADGAVVTAAGELWTWDETMVEHRISDCQCMEDMRNEGATDDELGQCEESTQTAVPTLVNLSGGDDLPLGEIEGLEETGEISMSADHKGTLGKYLFGTVCTYIYACGAAHGSVGCRSAVVDLEQRSVVELSEFMGDDAFAEVDARLRGRATDAIEEQASDSTNVTEPESAQLEAGWPVVTEDGLAFSYLFAAPTCYACSDGSWSSYTLGVEIRDDSVPEKLAQLAEPPPAVLAFLTNRDIPLNVVVGWSALPDDGDDRARLAKQFREAKTQHSGQPHGGSDE